MKPDLKRYELFGWDYERHSPISDLETRWYKEFAGRTGGPVLELACGTGRLPIPIAEEGYEVVGIDLSRTMLRLARERISRLPHDVQKRIRLHKGDMSDFQLNRQFGLVLVADNSFRELSSKAQMLACLQCCHRHLRPGGKLLVTVRRFDQAHFKNNERHIPWSRPIRHPDTGDLVTRRIETRLSEDGQWISGTMFYKTVGANGTETVEECPFEAPVMLTEHYISLFSSAGFSTSVFVGYEEREDDGQDPIICFVCDKI